MMDTRSKVQVPCGPICASVPILPHAYRSSPVVRMDTSHVLPIVTPKLNVNDGGSGRPFNEHLTNYVSSTKRCRAAVRRLDNNCHTPREPPSIPRLTRSYTYAGHGGKHSHISCFNGNPTLKKEKSFAEDHHLPPLTFSVRPTRVLSHKRLWDNPKFRVAPLVQSANRKDDTEADVKYQTLRPTLDSVLQSRGLLQGGNGTTRD